MPRLRLPTRASVSSWSRQLVDLQRCTFCSSGPSTLPAPPSSTSSRSQNANPVLDRTVFVRPSRGLVSPVQTLTLLAELSKRFGPIQSFHFPREPHQQRLLGYGSVTFANAASFERALAQSGTWTVTLPSYLPSRAPRTYLDDTSHAQLVGLESLLSCNEPPEGISAKQVHYTSRNLQNPSSMRPGWNDLGNIIGMQVSTPSNYVDESQADDTTPLDAVITQDSSFYLSDAPIIVQLKMERRHSSINSRASPKRGSRVHTDRKAEQTLSISQQLQQFGGFSGFIAETISEAETQRNQVKDDVIKHTNRSKGSRSGLPFTEPFQNAARHLEEAWRPSDMDVSQDTREPISRNEGQDRHFSGTDEAETPFDSQERSSFGHRNAPRSSHHRRGDDVADVSRTERGSFNSTSPDYHKGSETSNADKSRPIVSSEQDPGSRQAGTDRLQRSSNRHRDDTTHQQEVKSSSAKGRSNRLQQPREHRRASTINTHKFGDLNFRSYSSMPDKASRKADWKRTRHSNFIDQITVRLNGGKGGDGCVSFHREKFVEYGPPSGGNGGTGGSVYIRAIDGPTSLGRIARRSRASDAYHGQGSFLHGRRAADKIIEVPVGTVVTAVKRLRVKEDEEARVYRDDLLRRAAKSGWDPNRSVGKEDIVLAVEEAEHERIRSSLGLSRDEDADQDEEAVEKYNRLVSKIDGEALLDPDTAQQLQVQRDRVWRHYPRATETNYKRNEFRAAEMRLALDYRRQLSSMRSSQEADGHSVASVTPFEGEEDSMEERWQFDFDEPTPEDSPGVLVASGGKGGYGNGTFLSSQNRSPKFATKGEWGEAVEVLLELKRPSDIGLVGLPNAGKSTILRSLSASRAEVGHWQFTTLSPNLGVIRLDEHGNVLGVDDTEVVEGHGSDRSVGKDSREEGYRLVLADIPGLIDGASDNRGLGHTFLRHIERCSVLVYVLDLNQPEPAKDLRVLHNELATYRADLVTKAQLVVANKADLFGTEDEVNIAKQKLDTIRLEATKVWEDICATAVGSDAQRLRDIGPMKLVTLSAKKKQGTDVLAKALADLLKAKRAEDEALAEDARYDSSW